MKSFLTTWLAICALLPAAAVWAQDTDAGAAAPIENLEQSLFIDELSKRGYPELLQRLVEVHPPDSQMEKLQIAVATDRILYRQNQELAREISQDSSPEAQARAIELSEEASEAFSRMLENMQTLGMEYSEQDLRPMWQTDYAETLLTTYLATVHRNAADFYLFGVTSNDQREAFAEASQDALIALADADRGFADRQSRLPREPDHVQKRVNTGLWDTMMEDYWAQLTQYYLAQAAYFTAMLPNSAAYYQQLSQGGASEVLGQAKTPDAERKRLLQFTIDRGDQFLQAGGDRRPQARRMTQTLQGLAYLELGQPDQAVQLFDEVLKANARRNYTVWAAIGKARALAQRGQVQQAAEQIQELENNALVQQSPLYRLLVADAEHRILLEAAQKQSGQARERAIAAAYDPYIRLFANADQDPTLQALRTMVYERWAQAAEGESLASLPAAVRFGIAESQMVEAQNMFVRAQQAGDAEALAKTRPELQEAVEVYDTLGGSDVPANIKAPAMYKKGMALYMIAQSGLTGADQLRQLLAATSTWVNVAQQLPKQPEALDAMEKAARILTYLHSMERRPAAVETAYPAMAEVLFKEYGDQKVANDARLYYAQVMLRDHGQWRETAEMLAQVPPGHEDYFAAQRERLFALIEVVDAAEASQLNAEARRAMQVIEQVRQQAQETVERGGGQAADAQEALMASYIAEGEIALMQGKVDQALAAVDDFENRFTGQEDFIPQALQIRIRALAMQAELDQLLVEAREMMDRFPDDGASVISAVLDQIEQQIDELNMQARATTVTVEQRELQEKAEAVGRPASQLADMLYQWAQDRNLSDAQLIPYQLILVKANRMAGNNDEALRIIKQLIESAQASEENQAEKDPQVITQYGETLLESDDEADWAEAQKQFYTLIAAYQNERPRPAVYWNAWVQWLTAAEKLGRTDEIARTVQRLKMTNPDLGGQPYRDALERLEQRNR